MHYPSLADASTLCSRSMPNPSSISSSVYGSVSRASETRQPGRERPRIKRKKYRRDASCPAKYIPEDDFPHKHDYLVPCQEAIDEYMQEDLVGFDAGALPTETTSLLKHPYTPYTHSPQVEENRHEAGHGPQPSQIEMFREEIQTLLQYTGPIFGYVQPDHKSSLNTCLFFS